ncbi:hypothetical protein [Bacillus sp. FJAT-45350]|uniref:hypothetical protein n=1 Tax=Bacillus sp. FJAT-45350 TaxID=2011014 RepID=UPI000BB79A5C|nr:hypothetical protein [Bacillus sp. FJAT-45350]
MGKISQKTILVKFPWAKPQPLFNEIDTQEDVTNNNFDWNLNEQQLYLVEGLLEEIHSFFKNRDQSIDVKIYYIGELFDRLHIDFSSNTREVFMIMDKYKQFSEEILLNEDDETEQDEDYDDIF